MPPKHLNRTILPAEMQVHNTLKKCVAVIPTESGIYDFNHSWRPGEGMTAVETFYESINVNMKTEGGAICV